MSGHEQFADDLALYALNALRGEERLALEKHLAECTACRRELESLRGDTALLAFSVSGAKPPARARQRLLDVVARAPRRVEAARASWWWLPLFVTAILLLALALSWRRSERLEKRIAELESQSVQMQGEL